MPREMRLAARPHGGGSAYFNVTHASSCSPVADNVLVFKRAMLKGPSERKSGQHDVTTKSITTAMLVTALFFLN